MTEFSIRELRELFGGHVPSEAIAFLNHHHSKLTANQVRSHLIQMAIGWRAGIKAAQEMPQDRK